MANSASLLPGRGATNRGNYKVELALGLIYMAQVADAKALSVHLRIDMNNTYKLVARLCRMGLVQRITLEATSSLREREVLMLTPRGVVDATTLPHVVLHPYPLRPSDLEKGHLDHDAEVARLIGEFTALGAQLLGTHYTLQRGEKGRKVVDSLFLFDGYKVGVEYERTRKVDQELTNALSGAARLDMPMIWICARQEIVNNINELLRESSWPTWTKEPGCKWKEAGVIYASPWTTTKHIAVLDSSDPMKVPPIVLLQCQLQIRPSLLQALVQGIYDEGWKVGPVERYNDDKGDRWSFILSCASGHGMCQVEVMSRDGRKWTMRHDDHFRKGNHQAEVPYRSGVKIGARPPDDLLHAAVWTAKNRGYVQTS